MGKFVYIEYTGDDSKSALKEIMHRQITVIDDDETSDTEVRQPMGFQLVVEEDEDEKPNTD